MTHERSLKIFSSAQFFFDLKDERNPFRKMRGVDCTLQAVEYAAVIAVCVVKYSTVVILWFLFSRERFNSNGNECSTLSVVIIGDHSPRNLRSSGVGDRSVVDAKSPPPPPPHPLCRRLPAFCGCSHSWRMMD